MSIPQSTLESDTTLENNAEGQLATVLTSIQHIQEAEEKLYNEVLNESLDDDEKDQRLVEAEQLAQLRIQLMGSLGKMAETVRENADRGSTALAVQWKAVHALDQRIQELRRQIEQNKQSITNSIREMDISRNYQERYNAQIGTVQYLVIMIVIYIVFNLLYSKGIMPTSFYLFFTTLVLFIGGMIVAYREMDLRKRDPNKFSEYGWFLFGNVV